MNLSELIEMSHLEMDVDQSVESYSLWLYNPEWIDLYDLSGIEVDKTNRRVILYCGRGGPKSDDPKDKEALAV